MQLKSFVKRFALVIGTVSAIGGGLWQFLTRPDGKNFADRIEPDKIKTTFVADKANVTQPFSDEEIKEIIASAYQAEEKFKTSLPELSLYLYRNLGFEAVNSADQAQLASLHQSQYALFASTLQARFPERDINEIHDILKNDGSQVNDGKYISRYELSGQTHSYVLKLKNREVGFFQIISNNGKNTLETGEIDGSWINVAGVSVNQGQMALAAGPGTIAELLTGGEEAVSDITKGVYAFMITLGKIIAENPKIINQQEVDGVSFFILKDDMKKLQSFNLLPEGSVSKNTQSVRGMPAEELKVVSLTREQLIEMGSNLKQDLPIGIEPQGLRDTSLHR